jgi:hypothetical protein
VAEDERQRLFDGYEPGHDETLPRDHGGGVRSRP